MTPVYVLEFLRTPRGKASQRGSLHHLSPIELVVALQRELVHRSGLDADQVTDVVLGVATQHDEQGADLARTATLMAGWPSTVPGITVNRFCASGIDAVALAAARIAAAPISAAPGGLMVAGGVESVSRVPIFSDRGPLWTDPDVVQRVGSVHMGIAADLVATVDGRSREELDGYGLETQQKAATAWAEGRFASSVVPLPGADGTAATVDELVRAATTMDSLAGLPPAFAGVGAAGDDAIVAAHYPTVGPLQHLHTVGTSPQMADGAALLLLGDLAAAERAHLRPRARIVATASCAADPVMMLTAGQDAVHQVIDRAGLRPADIDVFEFAEAFSAVCLRFREALDAGPDRMNPSGGTMAMGHAFGATGAILVGQCVTELERLGGRYGVAAVSGAAGLGTAVLLERLG
jgi:acetyl-CoA C-acetyltransferase